MLIKKKWPRLFSEVVYPKFTNMFMNLQLHPQPAQPAQPA